MLKRHLEPELRPDASPREVMKQVILTMEAAQHTHQFTEEELISEAKEYGLSHDDAEWAIKELMEEHWLQTVEGSNEGLLERAVWRRYSPAFEEAPEFC